MYPLHPTVFERFAAKVAPDGVNQDNYRPASLEKDDRFKAYFDAKAAVRPDFSATVFRVETKPSIQGSLTELRTGLEKALDASDHNEGAILVLPSNPSEKNDPYRDRLALTHLDEFISRAGLSAVPVHLVSPDDPEERLAGRFVAGMTVDIVRPLAPQLGDDDDLHLVRWGNTANCVGDLTMGLVSFAGFAPLPRPRA